MSRTIPSTARSVALGGLPALARMRFVDDDREAAVAVGIPDLVGDEGELLDRRDDDLLALLDEPPEIAPTVRRAPRWTPPARIDRVPDLVVQYQTGR